MATNPCLEELEILKAILAAVCPEKTAYKGTVDGWSYLHVGKSWFYEKTITYDGNANSQDIIFNVPTQINRIEQIWNDTTAKDFSIRIFTEGTTNYIEIDTRTGNIAPNRVISMGSEYKYTAGSRLRIYSGVNTAGKTNTIRVQADEL